MEVDRLLLVNIKIQRKPYQIQMQCYLKIGKEENIGVGKLLLILLICSYLF